VGITAGSREVPGKKDLWQETFISIIIIIIIIIIYEYKLIRIYLAGIFLIPKSSFTVCRTVSLFIFNSSAITLTSNLRSERAKFHTLSTFSSVLCVFGCPFLGSSCTSSRPFLNRLCRSKILEFFIAY